MKTTILKMLRHKVLVHKQFHKLISKLQERAIVHDVSKFQEDEFDGFVEADSAGLYHKYGTEEYKKLIAENKGIKLHYERNTHHPEHFISGGINDMSFLDIVEMVLDWKAACETYGTDFKESIEFSLKRFQCDEKQSWLIKKIADDLEV